MREETTGIYGKPRFGWIVVMFGVALLLLLGAAVVFLRTGHPVFHTQPQPRNNKGRLSLPGVQHRPGAMGTAA